MENSSLLKVSSWAFLFICKHFETSRSSIINVQD